MGKISDILKTMEYGPAPEAADAVRGWLEARKTGFGCFIGGAFSSPGALFDVHDPSTGATIARVTQGSTADIDAAVAAARAAQPGWAALSGHERARCLYALARLVQKRERFLSVLESLDNGKPIRETRDIDIPLVARHFYHHAGWASLITSEFPHHRPLGVCGQIIPWNFPLLMLAWKIAPALACGNAVVLKPAEYTPLTALAFAEICVEAGLPAGVVNIVTGDGATGAALVEHDGVDKIAFTGSTEVGRLIRRATAGTGKKLSLELGGKSPFIVFDDCDLDSAVEGVVDGIFFNQGQVCCAGSRLLVAESVEARFLARLKARMAALTIGAPLDKSTDIGAIVAPVQLDRIRALVEAGRAEGAEIFQPTTKLPQGGSFYPPTLACGVEPANILAREEVFGPVLATMTFRTPDEAAQLANNSRYGLAASVWTENVNRAYEVAARLKAGVVWINSTNLFDAGAAFGGYRESGFGREGGREGLAEYLALDLPRSPVAAAAPHLSAAPGPAPASAGIDRTPKMYVGGKQARPDAGAVYAVRDPQGRAVGHAGLGGRKDIRNAVEAATKASGWAGATAHNRAQVLYYIAENLSARADEFSARLAAMTGADGRAEVEAAIRRLFFYAGFADKFDGAVRGTQKKFVTLAMNEPYGVMGIVCPDEAPLLALVSLVAPAIAVGNAVVAVPSAAHPLAATDFYTVLDASDLPDGVVNIVTGAADALALTLAEHDGVDALWRAGPSAGETALEAASAGNLKPTWMLGAGVDWTRAEGREFLRRACQIKTIWTPYGE
ncbi:MAG: aldehyde dehydrogenase family protein [Pseudomonadota bacterium]|nr:aldehyde dehydrogenase family protein [Pseudomonadota bacterium]